MKIEPVLRIGELSPQATPLCGGHFRSLVATGRTRTAGLRRRPGAWLAAAAIATALHIAVLAALLAANRSGATPEPDAETSVAMVFAPSAPSAMPTVAPDAATEAPETAPPVPPPPAVAAEPPPAAPAPEPPPPAVAEQPAPPNAAAQAEPPVPALPPPVAAEPPPPAVDEPTAPAEAATRPEPPVTVVPPPEPAVKPAPRRPSPPAAQPSRAAKRAAPNPDAQSPPMTAGPAAQALPPSPAKPAPDAVAAAANWRSALAAWLQSHRVYPEAARRRGEQGRVVVRFTVARDGQVRDVQLADSSGSARLDQAATDMLRQARLPPFPAAMAEAEVTASLPIRYELEP
ncbi:MAG: energy transducer TonB [Acetobacteraceae bacterium]|nr:energy transducer TonB [Acetobacteraceae bacterium]